MGSRSADEVDTSLAIFEKWLDENHIYRHPKLKLSYTYSSGWSVYAEADIPLGETLCAIPKSLVLSARTASFASPNPPTGPLEITSPGTAILYLSTCLLYELRLGENSKWYGHMQILPKEIISIPTLWGESDFCGSSEEDGREALLWLKGTMAEKQLAIKEAEGLTMENIRTYFTNIQDLLPLTPTYPKPPTLHNFIHAFTIITTRAFVLDSYHIIGLVPYVDMFNHSSTKSSTSLLTDSFVCPSCGSLSTCPHLSDRLENISPEYIDEIISSGKGDSAEMVAEQPIQQGQEVLSCYEPNLGDGKLLVEWGFLGRESSGDGIVWGPRDILVQGSIRTYMGIIQEGLVYTGSALIAPLKNGEEMGVFNLFPDGRISLNLLLGILLQHVTENIEQELEDTLSALDSGEYNATTRKIASSLIELFKIRLGSLHGSDQSLQDLRDLRNVGRIPGFS